MWREALKGTTILWRKVFFFGVVGIGLYGILRFMGVFSTSPVQVSADKASLGEQITAEASLSDNTNTASYANSDTYNLNMRLDESGHLFVNNEQVDEGITTTASYDELRYVVLDGSTQEGMTNAGFYTDAKITVALPKGIDRTLIPEDRRRLIATHGAVAQPSSFVDNQTIVFTATEVEPTAILTVLIEFPQGFFDLGLESQISRQTQRLSGIAWLAVSVAAFLVVLFIFLLLYEKSTGTKSVTPPPYLLESPPFAMSPALVGVLMHGRIRSKELLAMVIDLANRGLLGLEDRDGNLVIYKKQLRDKVLWDSLHPFERFLIDEFFEDGQTINTASDFRQHGAKDLFSTRVTQIYKQLYDEVTRLGLFEQNPAWSHWRYKVWGIGAFLFSVVGFLYAALTSPDPKFVLIFWVAMIAISLVATVFAGRVSTRTLAGRQNLEKWLAFRNTLTLGRPAHLSDATSGNFEKWLPYAVAMDVELEWAGRFADLDFHLPAWYGAARDIYDVQGFANSFFPLLGRFSEQMSFMKEPIVE